MNDAPETITRFIDGDMLEGSFSGRHPLAKIPRTEYRRADLPATDEQAMQNEKVKALVDALDGLLSIVVSTMAESERTIEYGEEDAFRMGEWFDDADHAKVMKARAALTALETPGNPG